MAWRNPLRRRRRRDPGRAARGALVSFPKSGRTWLRVMLDRLEVPLRYTHDGSDHKTAAPAADLDGDKTDFRHWRVVFLVRDPRDTAVSGYFQAARRIGVYDGNLSAFLRDDRHGLPKILAFHHQWHRASGVPAAFLAVRYEDLHADTPVFLRRILEFLEVGGVSEAALLDAVEYASFDNMQRMEREGSLRRDYGRSLAPTDPDDPDTYKTRRGRVGGYTDYLTEDDLTYCDRLMREPGSPFYAPDSVPPCTREGGR